MVVRECVAVGAGAHMARARDAAVATLGRLFLMPWGLCAWGRVVGGWRCVGLGVKGWVVPEKEMGKLVVSGPRGRQEAVIFCSKSSPDFSRWPPGLPSRGSRQAELS